MENWYDTENHSIPLRWERSLSPEAHEKNSSQSVSRCEQPRVYLFMCVLGNTADWRSCSLITSWTRMRVSQEVWTQTRYIITHLSSACLPHAYLFLPWKLSGVASMTKQNGFCHHRPALIKVFTACCVSGSHPHAAGGFLLPHRRSEVWFVKRPRKNAQMEGGRRSPREEMLGGQISEVNTLFFLVSRCISSIYRCCVSSSGHEHPSPGLSLKSFTCPLKDKRLKRNIHELSFNSIAP